MKKTIVVACWLLAVLCLPLLAQTREEEAEPPDYQGPDMTLTPDKLFGAYTFWQQTDAGYEYGFLEFRHDHTWTWVIHLDRDRDRLSDQYEVRRGEYAIGRRDDGAVGVWLAGEGVAKTFAADLRIVGGRAQTFRIFDRQFSRRQPGGTYFVLDNDLPDLAKELRIESAPAGAAVFIDNQQLADATPLSVKKPRANAPLEVRVVKPGYQPVQKMVTLAKDQTEILTFTLVQGEAGLRVTSLPRVYVKLDGNVLGSTPVTKEEIPAGQHQLELINETLGIHHREEIVLAKGEVWKKNFRFTGRVRIDVGRHCTIYRQGKKVGETPFDTEVPVGRHVLVLVDDRGERRQLLIEVEQGSESRIEKTFDSLPKADY